MSDPRGPMVYKSAYDALQSQLEQAVKERDDLKMYATQNVRLFKENDQLRERVRELEANIAEYDHGMAGDLIRERNALRAKAEGLAEALNQCELRMTGGFNIAREALAKWKAGE